MKAKIYCIVNQLWFVIAEIIVAVVYALFIYYRGVSSNFRMHGYLGSLLIELIVLLFFSVAVAKVIYKDDDNENRLLVFAYAVLIAADTCINDSLTGILFFSILLLFTVVSCERNRGCNAVAQIFLASAVGVEIVAMLSATDIIRVYSIVIQRIGTLWADFVLIFGILFQAITAKKSEYEGSTMKLIRWIVVAAEFSIIIILSIGVYLRINAYCVTASEIENGTSVYIVDANNSEVALGCTGNIITMSTFSNDECQMFKFEQSEVDEYWHIVANNSLVFDVYCDLFEDRNSVIAYEENGIEGQHWTVEDVDNNMVKFVSYYPEYELTWGEYVEDNSVTVRTLITSNQSDYNRYFFLKNANTVNTPIVGWIVNGNTPIVILAYILAVMLITALTCIIMWRYKRVQISREFE